MVACRWEVRSSSAVAGGFAITDIPGYANLGPAFFCWTEAFGSVLWLNPFGPASQTKRMMHKGSSYYRPALDSRMSSN